MSRARILRASPPLLALLLLTAPAVWGTSQVPVPSVPAAPAAQVSPGPSSIAQQGFLYESFPNSADGFGTSVAISGDTAVVSAPFESSNAVGVNGNQSNNGKFSAGAVFVFVRSNHTWVEEAYLKTAVTGSGAHYFGCSVAVSGDTIVVSNSFDGTDRVHEVFVCRAGTWTHEAFLPQGVGPFDTAVAVSGDTIAIRGGPEEVHVYERRAGTWTRSAVLSDPGSPAVPGFRAFGTSIAIDEDLLVVGEPGNDSGSPGTNGNMFDHSLVSGAAFVFGRSGGAWTLEAFLKASNPDDGDGFGESVDVSGNLVVVGAGQEDSPASGVNGSQGNGRVDSGAVYAFTRGALGWRQEVYLKASNPQVAGLFGHSVAASGDRIAVGAHFEWSCGIGVNGNQEYSRRCAVSGAAYLFERASERWSQTAYVKPPIAPGGLFGQVLDLDAATMCVGSLAFLSQEVQDSGAAFVFDACSPCATEAFRNATLPNPEVFVGGATTSGPFVGTVWDPAVRDDASNPNLQSVLNVMLLSPGPAVEIPLPLDTLLCQVSPESRWFFAQPGERFAVPIPDDPALVGVHACTQGGWLLPAGGGIRLANAIDVTVGRF